MTESNIVAVKTLATYLKAPIPELEIITEWPDAKHKMVLPCLSIITVGTPRIVPGMPILHSKATVLDEDDEPTINTTTVYIMGHYEAKIQLDLWTDYKAKRNVLYEKLMAAFDKQFVDAGSPQGLSLTLVDYHNCFARYDQTGYTYMDSGDTSQREEWRVKIDVEVSYPRLAEKVESIMAEITLKNRIDETVVAESEDPIEDDTNETLIIGEIE
jgi:hypothetical protein